MIFSRDVMNLLANLPNLEVLKADNAFNGTDWKLDEDVVFNELKNLQIKSGCLVRWEGGSNNFPMLEKLLLYGLNELEEIPENIGEIMTLTLIQIHSCGRMNGVEISAKKIQEEQESLGNYELKVQIT
ncbi:hypothetical protein H5410_060278 [Solanum commersonii]|uniref:Uncharacterized protein n=1 Tax=Solanum commersonii TaxID=4109 RepID=A0A9J5W5K0_SOLCO|nr:hypothetical protein H5410_060278 [Solanum commersonii]